MNDDNLESLIRGFALRNAVDHGGECRLSSVLGSVFSAREEARSRAGEVSKEAKRVVREVNSMSPDQQRKELEAIELPEDQEEEPEEGLPPLEDAEKGQVVMRLAPYPSGQLHLGRARMAILNDEYAKRYDGKLILVIDDTAGSADKIPIQEAYKGIPRDLDWLGVEYQETVYKSDRLEIFYSYAERFLKEGWAYACTCRAKELRENRAQGRECDCRSQSVEKNLEGWEKMLSGHYEQGEAAIRLKTDMQHPDAAFRDRVLLRISERPHPRVGTRYRVWPMLEFSWAIDDHLLGITHVLRGKDLMMEDKMERFMWDLLGWEEPVIIHHGMLGIAGAKMSSSECRRRIERGQYEGWEDPRTWSIVSLKARGIRARAIREFILSCGLSLTDVKVPVKSLYAENRKIIDPVANRYNFVNRPVRISVRDPPGIGGAELEFHPDFEERGTRSVPVDPGSIYIDGSDFEEMEGSVVRLKELYNVELESEAPYRGDDLVSEMAKIQWVSNPNLPAKVIMPDGSVLMGLADPGIRDLRPGSVIQFVRFGFCRLDSREGEEHLFRFAHR